MDCEYKNIFADGNNIGELLNKIYGENAGQIIATLQYARIVAFLAEVLPQNKVGSIINGSNKLLALPLPEQSLTVIGRTETLKNLENLRPGKKSLLDRLPDLKSPKANWKQN